MSVVVENTASQPIPVSIVSGGSSSVTVTNTTLDPVPVTMPFGTFVVNADNNPVHISEQSDATDIVAPGSGIYSYHVANFTALSPTTAPQAYTAQVYVPAGTYNIRFSARVAATGYAYVVPVSITPFYTDDPIAHIPNVAMTLTGTNPYSVGTVITRGAAPGIFTSQSRCLSPISYTLSNIANSYWKYDSVAVFTATTATNLCLFVVYEYAGGTTGYILWLWTEIDADVVI
jgi:hypothetical protein